MPAYYNENDPKVAAWLRELIKNDLIAPGDVDERSIKDVKPEDLNGYQQVSLFAGIGGWSLALRLAGVPDDAAVWTGSAPCQPFSCIGRGAGVDDERHLWPEMFRLISQCRPAIVFGEQVPDAIRHGWLDGVFDDLETASYACWATDLPACSVGAPTIRQRIWWVADADISDQNKWASGWKQSVHDGNGSINRLAYAESANIERAEKCRVDLGEVCEAGPNDGASPGRSSGASGLGIADSERESAISEIPSQHISECPRGFWGDFTAVQCADGKARRLEPGTFPLVDGFPYRLDLIRGYGNAINPWLGAKFVSLYREIAADFARLNS